MIEIFIFSAIRVSIPLCFATLAGFYSERSGIINIGLEGLMLVAAFSAAASAKLFHNPSLALSIALFSSCLLSLVFAFLCIKLKTNQTIAGIAITFLATGLNAFCGKVLFNMTGSTPSLDIGDKIPQIFGFSPMIPLCLFLVIMTWVIFTYTRFGQYLRFAGEKPKALETSGISVSKTQYMALIISGILCGLSGAYLSIDHGSSYVRNMTSGRGFIALAALMIGRHHPIWASLAALLFGAVEASQILFQSKLPTQWIQMIPFLLTVIIIFFTSTKKDRQF